MHNGWVLASCDTPCTLAATDGWLGNVSSGLDGHLTVDERRPSEFLTEADLERSVSIGMNCITGVHIPYHIYTMYVRT